MSLKQKTFTAYSSEQVYEAINDCLMDDPTAMWKFFKNTPMRVVQAAVHNAFIYNKGSNLSHIILRDLMKHIDAGGYMPLRESK